MNVGRDIENDSPDLCEAICLAFISFIGQRHPTGAAEISLDHALTNHVWTVHRKP